MRRPLPASRLRPASLPRPALTSEPLGVVLGGAERRLRPKASVHDSVAGLEIRGCGRVQAALCRGGWPGSGAAQGPASWPRLDPPLRSTGLGGGEGVSKSGGGLRGAPSSRGPALTGPGAHLRRRPRWTAWCQRGIEPARSAPRPPAAATLSGGGGGRLLEPLESWGVRLHSPLPVPWLPPPLLLEPSTPDIPNSSAPTGLFPPTGPTAHWVPPLGPSHSNQAPPLPSHPVAAAHGAE